MGRGRSKVGAVKPIMALTPTQLLALQGYRQKMTSALKVKIERTRSIVKQDGIFLNDDDLKSQIGNQLQTKQMDSDVIKASIDRIRFIEVPDAKGYGNVEVEFKPIITYQNTGRYQLGGGVIMKPIKKTLPRKTLRVRVMNV